MSRMTLNPGNWRFIGSRETLRLWRRTVFCGAPGSTGWGVGGGTDYRASNGLQVHGDDQTSLQGRLGGRFGIHFELPQGQTIEPYAKVEVIEEFLTGNNVRTNSTTFDSSLSGTIGRFGSGLTVRLNQSVYLYGEYDYATGDHFQQPWSVSAGLRWQW